MRMWVDVCARGGGGRYIARTRDLTWSSTNTRTQVLELKPDYSQAIDKRAKIYSSQGKFEEV